MNTYSGFLTTLTTCHLASMRVHSRPLSEKLGNTPGVVGAKLSISGYVRCVVLSLVYVVSPEISAK